MLSLYSRQLLRGSSIPQSHRLLSSLPKRISSPTLSQLPSRRKGTEENRLTPLDYHNLSIRRTFATQPVVEAEGIPSAPITWVDSLPKPLRPYLYLTRIDKPIGTWLLFWPCAWSITLASTVSALPVSVPLYYSSLFLVGATVMRGAGCTINDLWDRKIDAAVARTKLRPLAAGDVNPTQAMAFLTLQLSAGLAVLTQLNWYSIGLGASSLGLVFIYPAMKRITHWPQAVLGLAFNWGALLGWSAVAGVVDWSVALPLYFGSWAWTIVYDTIYAHQDKVDDKIVGVKSTALLFGDNTIPILTAFSTSFVGLLATTGYLAGASLPFYGISVLGAASHLGWQLSTVKLDSRESCWKRFRSNHVLGMIVWLGFVADYVYRVYVVEDVKAEDKEKVAAVVDAVAA